MAPARLLSDDGDDDVVLGHVDNKRRRLDDVKDVPFPAPSAVNEVPKEAREHEAEDATAIVPPHPLDIKASGNVYTATRDIKAFAGTLAVLPDELLLQLLEHLNAVDLLRLGGTCKALYAFCKSEDLWKSLFVESPPSKHFSWLGSWRCTFLALPPDRASNIRCPDMYSDALYLPFHRAHVPLHPFAQNIPARNQISRLANLDPDDFNNNWASKPFILTQPVKQWPLYKDWSWKHLGEKFKDTVFRAEAVDWPYSTYESFMRNNTDESPLYLFDCRFAEKMGLVVGDAASASSSPAPAYTPPACFYPDLFTALGPHRPDHRWLIIGPSRSGSTFHADPNGTSAWNAIIRGSKYWLMFPPTTNLATNPMPGLHVSPDGSHITAPLSIAEYLLTFHAEARRHPGCVEAICHEGEVLHVPSGWYHMVLNLEDGIALTQNFVPKAHLVNVLEFLRDKKEQVSGFGRDDVDDKYKGVEEGQEYELFVGRLREIYPEELAIALQEIGKRDEKRGRKSKWEELTGKSKTAEGRVGAAPAAPTFSFGFGFEDEDGEDEADEADEAEKEMENTQV